MITRVLTFTLHDISGNVLIDSLNLASANLGISDVRHLQKDSLGVLDEMLSFHSAAQKLTAEKDLKISFFLRKIAENHRSLSELLSKPWNSGLKIEHVEVIKKVPAVHWGSTYQFKLATPLKDKASFLCEEEGCTYTVTNHVVFKRHVKNKHGKVIKVDAPKVTCMMPHQQRGTRVSNQHTMDQICTHLKQVGLHIE